MRGAELPARVGPYAVEAELGRGGAGVVYLARDPAGSQVAVKLLLGAAAGDQRAQGRFEREIEALTRLRHRHLVGLKDAGRHGDHRYLVLEYLSGASLQQRLDARGPLPLVEAARVGIDLAEALSYVHRQGVIHRDLKPDNVLLDADDVPRLTDFGLVRELSGDQTRLTRTGAFLGSPGYWAPEQAAGEQAALGPRTDVYGLGALLYALVTGRPPHDGATLLEAFAAVARDPTPPSRLRPEIDPTLDGIIMRCLARDPDDRFRSAQAVGAHLEDWLQVGPSAAPPRGVIALAALALLLAAALTALLLGQRTPPDVVRTPGSAPLGSPTATPTSTPTPTPTPTTELASTRAAQVRVLLARAKQLQRARQWGEAQAVFTEVLERDPNHGEALYQRGWLRRIQGDPGGAILDFDRLLRTQPRHVEGHIERAAAKGKTGDVRGAIDDCTRAILLDDKSYRAHYDRSTWRMRLRPPAAVDALDDLERAVALNPTGHALADRGLIRHRLGRPGALTDLRAALRKLDPTTERYGFVKLSIEALLQERRREQPR